MPAKSPEAIRQDIEKALRRDPLFEHLTNEEYWEVSMITARSIARVALQDVLEEARFEKMMEEPLDKGVAGMPPLDMKKISVLLTPRLSDVAELSSYEDPRWVKNAVEKERKEAKVRHDTQR